MRNPPLSPVTPAPPGAPVGLTLVALLSAFDNDSAGTPVRQADNAGTAGAPRAAGRRPGRTISSARSGSPQAPRTIGEWACRSARAERDSIVAFRGLAAVLAGLGAPDSLVRRAHEAAIDEAGHTLSMLTLAPDASLGGGPRAQGPRTLLELAVRNAVQGCVGECWAALLAAHQAMHAQDPAVREAMTEIAPEEVAHAALAWDIAAWVTPRLDQRERRLVQRAHDRALGRLRRPGHLAHPDATRALGLPDRATAKRLAEAFAGWGGGRAGELRLAG